MPSAESISVRWLDSCESLRSQAEMVYRRLSFENELFTAIVYKRNYRTPTIRRLLTGKAAGKSDVTTRLPMRGSPVKVPLERDEVALSSKQAFFDACKDGDLDKVENFLRARFNVNERYPNPGTAAFSDTAIKKAARNGDVECVKILLRYGADIEVKDSSGWRPLHTAAFSGECAMVQFLIKNGACVTASSHHGEQPILIATEGSRNSADTIEIIQSLIDAGATVHCPDELGIQPIYLASMSRDHTDVIRFLVSRGADIEAGTSDVDEPWRPLHAACRRNHVGNVRALLALGAKTDRGNAPQSPLEVAMTHHSASAAEALLEHGVDLICQTRNGGRAFHLLANSDDLLLPPHVVADVSSTKSTFELLLQFNYQMDIHAKDEDGDNALHQVARNSSLFRWARLSVKVMLEIASLLISNGADYNILNRNEEAPLYLSVMLRDGGQLSNLLIESGARLLSSNEEGTWSLQALTVADSKTPIHSLHVMDLVHKIGDDEVRTYTIPRSPVSERAAIECWEKEEIVCEMCDKLA